MCVSADDAIESLLQGHTPRWCWTSIYPVPRMLRGLARMAPRIAALLSLPWWERVPMWWMRFRRARISCCTNRWPGTGHAGTAAGRVFMQPDRRTNLRHKLEAFDYLQFGIAALPG